MSAPAGATHRVACGGVYTWQHRAAMERYLDGDIVAGIKAHPHPTGLSVRNFAVLAEPRRVTRGWAGAALATA